MRRERMEIAWEEKRNEENGERKAARVDRTDEWSDRLQKSQRHKETEHLIGEERHMWSK